MGNGEIATVFCTLNVSEKEITSEKGATVVVEHLAAECFVPFRVCVCACSRVCDLPH